MSDHVCTLEEAAEILSTRSSCDDPMLTRTELLDRAEGQFVTTHFALAICAKSSAEFVQAMPVVRGQGPDTGQRRLTRR